MTGAFATNHELDDLPAGYRMTDLGPLTGDGGQYLKGRAHPHNELFDQEKAHGEDSKAQH